MHDAGDSRHSGSVIENGISGYRLSHESYRVLHLIPNWNPTSRFAPKATRETKVRLRKNQVHICVFCPSHIFIVVGGMSKNRSKPTISSRYLCSLHNLTSTTTVKHTNRKLFNVPCRNTALDHCSSRRNNEVRVKLSSNR